MTLVGKMRTGVSNKPVYQGKNNLIDKPELREKLRMMSKPEVQRNNVSAGNSILQSSQNYADQLRTQRQNAQATALKVKKLKYKFKDISSKIISSKTSHAAKQVAGQAKREVLRLKNQKRQDGGENSEELDAAIAHAKAMERVAKKKAKHLEEEELVKVKDGPGTGTIDIEDEKIDEYEDSSEIEEIENVEEAELEAEQEELEAEQEELEMQAYEDLMELTSELSEEMQAMMEEMEEFLMMDVTPGQEMSPEEFEELKLKHRNKEMKEIVKADADYMKAVFDSMEKAKTTGTMPVSLGTNATPLEAVTPVSVSMPQPIIDVSV